jgi:hypothetical protein
MIRKKDGSTFIEETTDCNGALNAIVLAQSCLVPLATLRGSDFGLLYNDLVVAIASAENSLGSG